MPFPSSSSTPTHESSDRRCRCSLNPRRRLALRLVPALLPYRWPTTRTDLQTRTNSRVSAAAAPAIGQIVAIRCRLAPRLLSALLPLSCLPRLSRFCWPVIRTSLQRELTLVLQLPLLQP